jgi:ribonuclease HIII
VIEELAAAVPDCPRALSDQFANPRVLKRALARKGVEIELEQRTKGESDVAVAAASILAREAFGKWIARASEQWGLKLAIGAGGPVLDAGRDFVARHGAQELRNVAKIHFKTTNQLTKGDSE